jgi:hypothetical protein
MLYCNLRVFLLTSENKLLLQFSALTLLNSGHKKDFNLIYQHNIFKHTYVHYCN